MHKAVYYTEQNNTVNSQSVDCTKTLKLFALAIMEVASATEHFLLAKMQANGTTYGENNQEVCNDNTNLFFDSERVPSYHCLFSGCRNVC